MGLVNERFYFDGRSSSEFGVYISGGGTFDAPARDLDYIAVPGRNGDVIFDNGRYSNIEVTYPAFIARGFEPKITAFRAWLSSLIGYKRLEDTYHLDEFRLASFRGGFDVSTTPRNLGGRFDVVFNCKPQRFLKSGEQSIQIPTSIVLNNPTEYTAKPLIRAYGAGTITINGISVVVQQAVSGGFTDIDCDLMEAYSGTVNCNGAILLPQGEFPALASGPNTIEWGAFDSVEITPRWWRL